MPTSRPAPGRDPAAAEHTARAAHADRPLEAPTFDAAFKRLFDAHFDSVFRYLDRLSGEADLAADLAQEAFIRLYRRGFAPEAPRAWLISVAMNLFRSTRVGERRRRLLLTRERGAGAHSEPPASPDDNDESIAERLRVRSALDDLPLRDRQLLLLRAEGVSYREIATALSLNAQSVGVLLARAKQRFRTTYEELRRAHR